MSSQVECPICMECVEVSKNCVTTECGHCFHASCLMRSVAHNGFGCPYCRTTMAETPEEEEEASVWSEVTSEEDEDEMFDNYVLRGLRFFMNNIEGEEHDEEDTLEEQEEDNEEARQAQVDENVKPTPAFIVQKLVEQGVTMEYLLKVLLRDHDEYDTNDEEFERVDDDVFGKLRIIISNYEPEEQQEQQEQLQQEQLQQEPEVVEEAVVDYESQPKQYANITVRRPMLHI